MDVNWGAIISAVAAISGVLLGWTARSRDSRREDRGEAAADAALRADMAYIKRGVDEIKQDLRTQGTDIDQLRERITKVEESAKSTLYRLDRMEEAGSKC